MRKLIKHVLFVSLGSSALLFSGCTVDPNLFSPIPQKKPLKDRNGESVRDCGGGGLPVGYFAEKFWEENNLPKGTTEFVCVDGYAYLPSQVPIK